MNSVVNMREDPNQKQGLIDLCNYLGSKMNTFQSSILEVGCYQGESSEIFAAYFGNITCVDIWSDIEDLLDGSTRMYPMVEVEENFNSRMERFLNVTKVKCDFQNFDILKTYDVIYIDANHEYLNVKNDINKVLGCAKWRPTFLAGHDYTDGWPGVIQVVDQMFGKPDKVFIDNSWIVRLN